MADLYAGPNAPLSKAFIFCGWETISVDWLIDSSHDLADPRRQESLHEQLKSVCFIAAALDCSTKSRAREIPRDFGDGRPPPQPLRSEQHPLGLPNLSAEQATRVHKDNMAAKFVLSEIALLANRGGGSVRENPYNSLHWWTPEEMEMWTSGHWRDQRYSACCFGGARAKLQRLRHNLDEIAAWPRADCNHFHDPGEWEPWLQNGKRYFPSAEESEYTAELCFAIAVAASWWAVRTGHAKLYVPRSPAPSTTGHREHWLDIDPRALRAWAMAPLAIALGLRPLDTAEAARVPQRACLEDVLLQGALPARHVYVGLGSHSHRLPTTKWKSPWQPGVNCSPEDWMPLYVQYIRNTLWDELTELEGQVLVCDCPMSQTCEADLLAGLVFDRVSSGHPQGASQVVPGSRTSTTTPAVRAVLLSTVAQARGIPFGPVYVLQESFVLAFRKLYPGEWFVDFKFPLIEDVINQHPLDLYLRWRYHQGAEMEGSFNPVLASPSIRQKMRTSEGQQVGAINHRAALAPLLPFHLDPDQHFARALDLSVQPLPTEGLPVLDDDLKFSATFSSQPGGDLSRLRKAAMGLLAELRRRWACVTSHLRSKQPPAIQRATSQRDIGFTAVMILLANWGDITFPAGLCRGLPAVGFAPPYGIFPEQESTCLTREDVLAGWQRHNASILARLKPGANDEFLLQQSLKDAEKGFCSQPMTVSTFQKMVGAEPFRLIPRCVITQASGKQRVIDDAYVGLQSERSSDANKLVLCSALRPAQHLQYAYAFGPLLNDSMEEWESGGEDWPDAYRFCPMSTEEAMCCVVTFFHHEWHEPAVMLYTGLLFGLPLAVTSFNRYSRLVEALARRFLFCLTSLYFDDAHITDRKSCKGSGQWAIQELNRLLGTPFSAEKCQRMHPTGTFLGLDHDFTEVATASIVRFWARERIQEKLVTLMDTATLTEKLPPGVAAKIYGIANFFEMGVWGRIGCGGLAPIKQRQQERSSELTGALKASFQLLRAIIQTKPSRCLEVLPYSGPRFLAASDAALEQPRQGTGGFLIVWHDTEIQEREAFVSVIPPSVYDLWGPGDKKIAQLELLQVLYALFTRPSKFRGRRGLWFIDNTAALMALVRGRSDNADLEHMSRLIHLTLFALRAWFFWEWIPSKANWSDEISRDGLHARWHVKHDFSTHFAIFPFEIWSLPPPEFIRVVEFL